MQPHERTWRSSVAVEYPFGREDAGPSRAAREGGRTYRPAQSAVREQLDPAAFDAARVAGRTLSLEDAIAEALADRAP